ncbi:hypothetical protein [Devosia aurantiaca]|uniref:Uncharacterized protein n=1 Tax=Devosia aurantiaca TaxID=2714858 RepID=A0A6M1SPR0_9HYPH|nr:hypothetical protein [Devosia aurantiaca]NGP18654.1 hypothetical protein [Devosia aurantiaca]
METHANVPQAMIEGATRLADWVLVLPVVLCLIGAAAVLALRRTRVLTLVVTLMTVLAVIACEIALLVRVAGKVR